jgi:tetratricopeptide (TPR) repeat protein
MTTGFSGRRARTIGWLIAVCAVGAWLIPQVQGRIDAQMDHATLDPDILYFSSPRVVRAMALGFDDLVADVYWMRAIQYYGRRDEAARRKVPYKNLAALLDIVTTLDPKMVDVYRVGTTFLAEPEPIGAGKPQESIRLLDKGIAQLPEEWRLRYDKGFVYYLYMRDYRKAGETWLAASRIPGVPPWMEGLAANSLNQGGAMETARNLWRRQLEESTRADLRDNAKNHLDSIQVDETIWTLEFLLEKYKAARGAFPPRLVDLPDLASLQGAILDPSGISFEYAPATGRVSLSPQTKVRYLPMSYDYRSAFLERLERAYQSQRK